MTFVSIVNLKCLFWASLACCYFLLISVAICAPLISEREKKDVLLLPAVRYVFVPTIVNPNDQQPTPTFYQQPLNQQQTNNLRGPFDFIGNWIQGSDWFPIEVNVPDTVSNATGTVSQWTQNAQNGLSQFGQNVGQWTQNAQNGFNQFTTNLGSNWNQFASGLGNRFPQISQATQNIGNGVNQFTSTVGNGVNQVYQNVGNGFSQVTGNIGNWVQTVGQRIPVISQFVGQNNRVPVQGASPQNVLLVVPSEGDLLETFP